MEQDIIVTLGQNGLASSVAVPTSGMICDIFYNTNTHITAAVAAQDAWCEIELSRLPYEEGLYWVRVMPYGFECAFTFGDFGFPGGLFKQHIPKPHERTMVAEALVVLSKVMGHRRHHLSNFASVMEE